MSEEHHTYPDADLHNYTRSREFKFYEPGLPVNINRAVDTTLTGREDTDVKCRNSKWTLANGGHIEFSGRGKATYHAPDGETEKVDYVDVDVSESDPFDEETYSRLKALDGETVAYNRNGFGSTNVESVIGSAGNKFEVIEVLSVTRGKVIVETNAGIQAEPIIHPHNTEDRFRELPSEVSEAFEKGVYYSVKPWGVMDTARGKDDEPVVGAVEWNEATDWVKTTHSCVPQEKRSHEQVRSFNASAIDTYYLLKFNAEAAVGTSIVVNDEEHARTIEEVTEPRNTSTTAPSKRFKLDDGSVLRVRIPGGRMYFERESDGAYESVWYLGFTDAGTLPEDENYWSEEMRHTPDNVTPGQNLYTPAPTDGGVNPENTVQSSLTEF